MSDSKSKADKRMANELMITAISNHFPNDALFDENHEAFNVVQGKENQTEGEAKDIITLEELKTRANVYYMERGDIQMVGRAGKKRAYVNIGESESESDPTGQRDKQVWSRVGGHKPNNENDGVDVTENNILDAKDAVLEEDNKQLSLSAPALCAQYKASAGFSLLKSDNVGKERPWNLLRRSNCLTSTLNTLAGGTVLTVGMVNKVAEQRGERVFKGGWNAVTQLNAALEVSETFFDMALVKCGSLSRCRDYNKNQFLMEQQRGLFLLKTLCCSNRTGGKRIFHVFGLNCFTREIVDCMIRDYRPLNARQFALLGIMDWQQTYCVQVQNAHLA
jgi:hypothetical protein